MLPEGCSIWAIISTLKSWITGSDRRSVEWRKGKGIRKKSRRDASFKNYEKGNRERDRNKQLYFTYTLSLKHTLLEATLQHNEIWTAHTHKHTHVYSQNTASIFVNIQALWKNKIQLVAYVAMIGIAGKMAFGDI